MDNGEDVLFNNNFGKVTNKRISLNYKTGTEDIPLKQITSVSLQHKRNYFFSVSSFIVAFVFLVFMIAGPGLRGPELVILLLIFAVALLSGIANWFGHHNIVVSTAGTDRKPLKVEMAKTKDGREFVLAVKKALFN